MVVVLIIAFVVLLFFVNFNFAKAQPGGTDFLYRWLPTRLVLLDGYENPYSSAVEYQVELMHHGHAHRANETPGIFAYPYYAMGVFLPFALVEHFPFARAAWMTLMELSHLAITLLTLKMMNFTPTKLLGFSLMLFALLPSEFAQPLVDGNPSSIAALFAILALFSISCEKDSLAGVFLTLSTIKPQLVIIFFALVWIWAFSNRRWKILYASAVSLFIVVGVSFLLQPSWFTEFIKDLTTYTNVARPSTPRAILSYWMPTSTANLIAWGLSTFSFFILFRSIRFYFGKGFSALLWVTSLIFILMPLTGITSAKSNYVAMLPTVILLIWVGSEKMNIKSVWLSLFLLSWIPLSWLFFFAGRNWVVNGTLIYFVDFYPLPLLLLLLYFWTNPLRNNEVLVLNDR
jgi:hypothetical protein